MLEEFCNIQKDFVEQVKESIINKKNISHAYLIETNSFSKSKELVFAFAKILLCQDITTKKHDRNCRICNLIDKNNYPELITIEPDGQFIKKEQLLNMQTSFKTKALDGGNRLYIIFDADKLNVTSANTLLKFLEEPEEKIIAVLVTENRYRILETILSRCQILSLRSDDENLIDIISEDKAKDFWNIVKKIEFSGVETIAYTQDLWYDKFSDKNECLKLLNMFETLYLDLLENNNNREFLKQKYGQAIDEIFSVIDIENIIYKLRVIEDEKNKLQYNINLKLWIDNFIIKFTKGGDINA